MSRIGRKPVALPNGVTAQIDGHKIRVKGPNSAEKTRSIANIAIAVKGRASITLATKMIQAQIRRAGLLGVAGSAGATNVQGETQQKLDVYANEALLHCLGVRDAVAVLVSEENEEPVTFDRAPETGKYVVIFDPLDGSSNIDVNVSVGTIFSIFLRPEHARGDLNAAVLQAGAKQVAAGYVVYGSSRCLFIRRAMACLALRSIRISAPLC